MCSMRSFNIFDCIDPILSSTHYPKSVHWFECLYQTEFHLFWSLIVLMIFPCSWDYQISPLQQTVQALRAKKFTSCYQLEIYSYSVRTKTNRFGVSILDFLGRAKLTYIEDLCRLSKPSFRVNPYPIRAQKSRYALHSKARDRPRGTLLWL